MRENGPSAVEAVILAHSDGIAIRDILPQLHPSVSRRTLQHWLRQLVEAGRVARAG